MLLIMRHPHAYRVVLLTLSLVMVLLEAEAPVLTKAQSTPVATPETMAVHGINMADMDLTVSPSVDFYTFANGGWLERTNIPADRTQVSTLSLLTDQTVNQQIKLLRDAAGPDGAAAGSDEAKAAAIFTQGLEMQVRDRQGIAPIQDALERIAASTRRRPTTRICHLACSMVSAPRCLWKLCPIPRTAPPTRLCWANRPSGCPTVTTIWRTIHRMTMSARRTSPATPGS